jgi:hypothetical protein
LSTCTPGWANTIGAPLLPELPPSDDPLLLVLPLALEPLLLVLPLALEPPLLLPLEPPPLLPLEPPLLPLEPLLLLPPLDPLAEPAPLLLAPPLVELPPLESWGIDVEGELPQAATSRARAHTRPMVLMRMDCPVDRHRIFALTTVGTRTRIVQGVRPVER